MNVGAYVNTIKQENRIGRFTLTSQLLQALTIQELNCLFADVFIRRTDDSFIYSEEIQYLAYSKDFEPVAEGVTIPVYVAEICRTGKGILFRTWIKQ